jgi:hypothetical protein
MKITLASGNTVSANAGVVGIDRAGNLYGGYDEEIFIPDSDYPVESLSPSDRMQIAGMAIERWATFRAKAFEELQRGEESVPDPLNEGGWLSDRGLGPIKINLEHLDCEHGV